MSDFGAERLTHPQPAILDLARDEAMRTRALAESLAQRVAGPEELGRRRRTPTSLPRQGGHLEGVGHPPLGAEFTEQAKRFAEGRLCSLAPTGEDLRLRGAHERHDQELAEAQAASGLDALVGERPRQADLSGERYEGCKRREGVAAERRILVLASGLDGPLEVDTCLLRIVFRHGHPAQGVVAPACAKGHIRRLSHVQRLIGQGLGSVGVSLGQRGDRKKALGDAFWPPGHRARRRG